MALMRRVAALGAAVAAARQYARQNPEKVNRYADQAASFLDRLGPRAAPGVSRRARAP